MVNQNGLVQIINNAIPIVASSPVLIKLMDSVTEIIKTLYTPMLTLKKGKAEVDIEVYREQKNKELLDNQTFTLYEINKLKNFAEAVNYAAKELENCNEDDASKDNVDFDWVMRFFDAVGNISNKDLQSLWGKILAGETRRPGVCSLRTLDIVRNLTQTEAETFNKLCRYVVQSGDCSFIMNNGFLEYDGINAESKACIERANLVYSKHVVPLIECGLLSVDNKLAYKFETDEALLMISKSIMCMVKDETKENYLSIEPYFLSTSGMELFNIIRDTPSFIEDREYIICCYKELKQLNPQLTVSAYNILADNSFDISDVLL